MIYHRVLPERDSMFPTEITAADFSQLMALVAANFHVLPLGEAVARLRGGTLPSRAACITFDDGYADNARVALPILREQRLPATFFITAGFLDGSCMWNDALIETVRRAPGDELDLTPLGFERFDIATPAQRRAVIGMLIRALKYSPPVQRAAAVESIRVHVGVGLPSGLMMSHADVRSLHSAGMEIGAHTLTHPILARLEDSAARAEIAAGREILESTIRGKVALFAYPNGKPGQDYAAQHVDMVKELGFAAAVSTAWGAGGRDSDPYQLPRFTPWDRTPGRFLLRLMSNLFRASATA